MQWMSALLSTISTPDSMGLSSITGIPATFSCSLPRHRSQIRKEGAYDSTTDEGVLLGLACACADVRRFRPKHHSCTTSAGKPPDTSGSGGTAARQRPDCRNSCTTGTRKRPGTTDHKDRPRRFTGDY